MEEKDFVETERKHYWPVFARYEVLFERGSGVYLYDAEGREYIDFVTGVGVVPLGHSNREVNERLIEQAEKIYSCSNLFYSLPQLELAKRLSRFVKRGRWFFSNSGAEAFEAALKVARRYGEVSGRKKIVTLKGSFHGRTFGAMSATGQEKVKKGYGSLLSDFVHIEPEDFDALEKEVDGNAAALIVEIIQGEGGVRIIGERYLERAYELCKEFEALFVVDEIQTGLGRTGGEFLACRKRGLEPDIVTLAKGLANGLPVGATWIRESLSELLKPGDHGSTYGGNAICTAVAEKVVEIIERESLIEKNADKGKYFLQELWKRLHKNDKVKSVRGEGMMVGIEFYEPVAQVIIEGMMKRGVLAAKAGDFVVRFLPPFIAEDSHFEAASQALRESVEECFG